MSNNSAGLSFFEKFMIFGCILGAVGYSYPEYLPWNMKSPPPQAQPGSDITFQSGIIRSISSGFTGYVATVEMPNGKMTRVPLSKEDLNYYSVGSTIDIFRPER